MSNPTAAAIIIGNEILSGRTLDINTQEIALALGEIGVLLIETRTIADDRPMIIDTVRELSSKYDYIFTTGGIGPTHDDITAEAMAAAFNVSYIKNVEIYNILENYYHQKGEKLNSAREKMAYIPESSKLLYNDATAVPGFVINNVFVMAGIPHIMKAMLKSAIPMLKKGRVVQSKTLDVMMAESKIAIPLEELQNKYRQVDMGSYPFTKDGQHGTALVLRSSDYDLLSKAFGELEAIIKNLSV
jgi:molybdenum cofactor synthesis domain-containing protein